MSTRSVPSLLCALALAAGLPACLLCDDIKAQAQGHHDKFAACGPGDSCVLVEGADPNDCTGTFVCATAINAEQDQEAYRQRAQEIADSFRQFCQECAMPGCISPDELIASCNTETGLCELHQRQ